MMALPQGFRSDTDVSRLLSEPVRVACSSMPPRITFWTDWHSELEEKRAQQAELRLLLSSLRETFPALRPAGSVRREPALRARHATLLVVDDDATVRRVVADMLAYLGYAVLHACNGQEAIEVLEAHGSQVALVLMDVHMPRMDARAAVPILQAKWPTLPVLLSSGEESIASLRTWQPPNVVGFLPKPYRLSTLEQVLAQAILQPAL